MILGLTLALVLVSVAALVSAYGHGREWWGATKAKRERDAAIKERDVAKAEHDKCWQGAMELSDRVAILESEQVKALAKISEQKSAIESSEAEACDMRKRLDGAHRAIDAYKALQETSNHRIDELTAEVKSLKAANESSRSDLELLRLETINTSGIVKQAAALLATVA